MTFFTDFKRSLLDRIFYKEVAAGQHPLRLQYAGVLAAVFALVMTVIFAVSLYAVLIPEGRDFIKKNFPTDLIATLKSGELSINQSMPYKIPLSSSVSSTSTVEHANFLVIDTGAEATLDAPEKYDTYLFINKTSMVAEKSSSEIRAYPLKEFPDFTLTHETVLGFFDAAAKFAWIVPVCIFLFMTTFSFIGLLFTYLFAGALLWIIMRIASRKVLFANAFKVSMYAHTFIFILGLFLMAFSVEDFGFFSSVFLTVITACLFLFTPAKSNEAE